MLTVGRAVPQKGAKTSAAKNTAGETKKKNIASKSTPKKSGANKTKGS